jgi:hypothetical protein
LIQRGRVLMSQNDDKRKYRIDIGAYGSIGIEAPTKEECLELFKEVTRTKRDQRIDEAIR